MNEHRHARTRGWKVVLGAAALALSPVILYYLLGRAGLPMTMVSGVIVLMALKHLGLLALLLGPLGAAFRQRHH
jgi:hypothetical protein